MVRDSTYVCTDAPPPLFVCALAKRITATCPTLRYVLVAANCTSFVYAVATAAATAAADIRELDRNYLMPEVVRLEPWGERSVGARDEVRGESRGL